MHGFTQQEWNQILDQHDKERLKVYGPKQGTTYSSSSSHYTSGDVSCERLTCASFVILGVPAGAACGALIQIGTGCAVTLAADESQNACGQLSFDAAVAVAAVGWLMLAGFVGSLVYLACWRPQDDVHDPVWAFTLRGMIGLGIALFFSGINFHVEAAYAASGVGVVLAVLSIAACWCKCACLRARSNSYAAVANGGSTAATWQAPLLA
jgi:hypothetical protein